MAVARTRGSLWQALAGRPAGQPVGPVDTDLWTAVVERVNPAKARPRLRPGVEQADLVSARGSAYVMLRSPDAVACYARLTTEEMALARLMDGERTLARLVAEFARLTGRLAPEQVRRVVADLAGNRMLEELPVDAFRPLAAVHRPPWPVRLGRGLMATARGRRMLLVDVDRFVGALYRGGGRLLFTRPAAVVMILVAVAGLGAFGWTWWQGAQSLFLTGGSYATGAAVLLGLNAFALACHELGHGLAAKHAGRRVPVAGVLVYFGIPSVFVDTSDVWMAGRRARLLTTAAGPATGLVLAGAAGLLGLVAPELAGWTFKLAFVWYLSALFNLNPFLALDGYYLLMDWLEVPNLRARGLAWVRARMRPGWRELDGEGRLIALYGVLAALWVVIALNLAYRIYADRVSGLVTGVWRSGWPGRILLAAVVAGLAAPLVYAAAGWLAARWRAIRRWWERRQVAADLPRRRAVLLTSTLAELPVSELDRLAARARWVHPPAGSPLVRAGAAQPEVFVVAEGAVEGRRPGDPGGTIRQRVGPGGVVGLSTAMAGAPAALSWHTVGTTLLALPAAMVASAVAGSVGPETVEDRAEAEELFAETPGLAELGEEERADLTTRARPVSLPPGETIAAPASHLAMVVGGGVLEDLDGGQLRRGAVILPAAPDPAAPVARTRTRARLWLLPIVALASPGAPAPGRVPGFGVHPASAYPPLAIPPGPPPADLDGAADHWFERRLRWLVLLLLLLALLLTGSQLVSGPAWSEMPADHVLLSVERGWVDVTDDTATMRLAGGDRHYLGAGDQVEVGDRSVGKLTLHGGSAVLACAGSVVRIGAVDSQGVRPIVPGGDLALGAGTLLVDTASVSPAYVPPVLAVRSGGREIVNQGEAWYAVSTGGVSVSVGTVVVDGAQVTPTETPLTCGDGVPVPRAAAAPSASPGPSPALIPTPTPTPDPTVIPSPSPPGPPPAGTPAVGPQPSPVAPTTGPTTSNPPPAPPPTTTSPPPPPDTVPPVIGSIDAYPYRTIHTTHGDSVPCNQEGPVTTRLRVAVMDQTDEPGNLSVAATVRLGQKLVYEGPLRYDGKYFSVQLGPHDWKGFSYGENPVHVVVRAADRAGNSAETKGEGFLTLINYCVVVR